ncbi:MAG TPA: hypothetical protein VKT72_06885 [Candidatus Baltobacteraceae bacterium]|nr:hypothetical protein [Candidatus Baltobacteraceae bacterium]
MRPRPVGMQSAGSRFTLLLFFLLALVWAAINVATLGQRSALYGWNVAPDGTTLESVTPGMPAAKAGLRAGDRIDWRSLPASGRADLGFSQNVLPGSMITVRFHRGGVAHVATFGPQPTPPIIYYTDGLSRVAGSILLLIAVALVYLRPSRMTWAFALASLEAAHPYAFLRWSSYEPAPMVAANVGLSLVRGCFAAGILIFVSRFPTDSPRGALAFLDRFAIPAGLAYAAIGIYTAVCVALSGAPPAAWAFVAYQYVVPAALLLTALAALTSGYLLHTGSDRQRIAPVLAAFAFYVATIASRMIEAATITSNLTFGLSSDLVSLSQLTLAAAVLYAVLTRRVFDLSFAVSKTLVYTIITSLIVGAFVLIDFVSSKILSGLQITLVLEACVALGFGIWLNAMHNRIDRFVDRVLFRRRHLAEARLERAARTLAHAESCDYIDEVLTIEACDALDLSSAAVFRSDGDPVFKRFASRGWSTQHAVQIASNDRLSVTLKAELQTVHLADTHRVYGTFPIENAQPLMAIPFVVRHELEGFVLYGAHSGGEAVDPDEQRVLERLAQAAAAAYEYLRARALQDDARGLRAEIDILQREQRLLYGVIDKLGGVPERG